MNYGNSRIWKDYRKVEKLGQGAYGKVYKAVHRSEDPESDPSLYSNGSNSGKGTPIFPRPTPKYYAIKKMLKDPQEGVSTATVREISALKACKGHPFIVG
jgi:serine/threonine protein kinase